MTETEFWKLIESTRADDSETHAERLTARLAKRDVKEILAFGHLWERFHDDAKTWALWGAAYLINGGCSDDGFTDFRSWLILQGESTYREALASPDSLANIQIEADEANCECYPAPDAYKLATKADGYDSYYAALTAAYGPLKSRDVPAGEEWDFDDDEEMENRLPDLFANYSS